MSSMTLHFPEALKEQEMQQNLRVIVTGIPVRNDCVLAK